MDGNSTDKHPGDGGENPKPSKGGGFKGKNRWILANYLDVNYYGYNNQSESRQQIWFMYLLVAFDCFVN